MSKLNYTFYEDALRYNGYTAGERLNIPILIVHGEDDEVVPLKQSVKLAEVLTNGKLVVIPKADHRFNKKEDADKVVKLVTHFIINNLHNPHSKY